MVILECLRKTLLIITGFVMMVVNIVNHGNTTHVWNDVFGGVDIIAAAAAGDSMRYCLARTSYLSLWS